MEMCSLPGRSLWFQSCVRGPCSFSPWPRLMPAKEQSGLWEGFRDLRWVLCLAPAALCFSSAYSKASRLVGVELRAQVNSRASFPGTLGFVATWCLCRHPISVCQRLRSGRARRVPCCNETFHAHSLPFKSEAAYGKR